MSGPIPSSPGRYCLYAYSALAMLFLVGPIIVIIPMSFSGGAYLQFPPEGWSLRWYRAYFGSSEWRAATMMSLQTATLTVLVATPLGTAAAYGLRCARTRWSALVQLIILLPLMVPIILIGIGVFFVYARIGLNNTLIGLVLAHSLLALPFVFFTVSAGLKSFDMRQEQAARSLGAGRLKAFMTVTFPQIRFSVIAGALFAFVVSLDEVVIALFIAGGGSATITRRMFNSLRDQIDPTIAAISTVLIGLSMFALLLVFLFGRERRKTVTGT